jgi:Zn-dependent M32 family carboxypeptidase
VTEQEILARYSTPGLRRCELSRAAKKAHLATLRRPVIGEEAEKVLAELYPEKTLELTEAQREVLEIVKKNADIAHKVLRDWITKRFTEIERMTDTHR